MAIVYSYSRFSSPEQAKGDSQRRQLDATNHWVAANGHTLDTTLDLRDRGVSAFKGKNAREGALRDFLNAIEAGKVLPGSILAIESFDRLSRQPIDETQQLIRGILKSGVDIKTFTPNDYYTAESLNDAIKMIVLVTLNTRSHEESATKSERVCKANAMKRERIRVKKFTSTCPGWLRPILDSERRLTDFELIPDRADVVRRLFRMAIDGMGCVASTKALNAQGVPTFGRGRNTAAAWSISSVRKILGSRAVLGEYQMHLMSKGRRMAVGDPVTGYFPRVVEDAVFYTAQQRREARKSQPGRVGKGVANLFTGLVIDARDGTTCRVVNKGDGPALVSKGAANGQRGSVYVSFPYRRFETAMLVWGYDRQLADVLPRRATDLQAELAAHEGKVADVANRIATLKTKMKTAEKFDVLVDLLVDLEKDKATAAEAVERVKREMTTTETEALDRTKDLIRAIRKGTPEEAHLLRLKLRTALKRIVRNITLLTIRLNSERVALVDVELTSGLRRRITVTTGGPVLLPAGLEELDLRAWRNWPEDMKATRFDAPTAASKEMARLEAKGVSRTDIAARLGLSNSSVSRTLLRGGNRKRSRKAADSEWHMSWHGAGRGWVKCHGGKRYFIGLGKLAARFPALVETKTPEGSWRAANAWWGATVAALGTTGE